MIICHFLPFAFAVVIEKDDQKKSNERPKMASMHGSKMTSLLVATLFLDKPVLNILVKR